ncbi:MAG: hypothetical protein JWM07_241 [Candidatus Saccharibacteria bacterium]|nr:hypothetical protein [Candidatus Saccharibacteria bacterium]
MSEILSTAVPAEKVVYNEDLEARRFSLAPSIGGAALFLTSESVQAFYGGKNHYLGRGIGERNVRSIVSMADGTNEVVAVGTDAQDSMTRTLEAMHTLETADTRPIARFPVNGTKVSFTELQHYAPKIAPALEAYPVPTHLDGVLKDYSNGIDTYIHTTEQDGWQQQLFEQVNEYIAHDDNARNLMDELDIQSVIALTPEQAVKLSLGVVQMLSKYSWVQEDGRRVAGGKREDNMTTMQLLAEGEAHVGDVDWPGNGVCRNVASNVKAVFEALKANQSELSMLRNTYAVYTGGKEGYGSRKRDDVSKFSMDGSGHAWNTFVTVGKSGESCITIVDATWAMGRSQDGTLKEPDYTSERMYENIAAITENVKDKADVALVMSDYLDKFTRFLPSESDNVREQKRQFALTEWLKIAPTLIEADMQSVPAGVTGAAYRLGSKLDKSELQTLYAVEQAGWIENFDAILGKYINGDTHLGGIDRFIARDDGLQRAIYDKLGAKVQEYADRDVDFRTRLRDLEPSMLPNFDPENNPPDKLEMTSLMRETGLFGGSRYYGDVVRAGLLRSAKGDQHIFDDTIKDMSDYDLLRNYRSIRSALAKQVSDQ